MQRTFYNDKRLNVVIEDDITLINMCVHKNSPKMHDAKSGRIGEIYNSTVRVGDIIASLSIMDRTIRNNISKEIEDLTRTIN